MKFLRTALVVIFFGFYLLISQNAFATKICILRGFDFSIYDEVVSSFKGELRSWDLVCDLVLKNNQSSVGSSLRKSSPDVVLALGNSAVSYMEQNFPNIPVVYGMAKNVEAKQNKSGISIEIPFEKQLQLVRKASNSLNRIGIIYSVKNISKAQEFISSAKRYGILVNSHAVSSPQEVIKILPKLRNEDLFWILLDEGVLTVKNRDEILELANKLELKTYAFSPVYLKGPYGADLSVSISWSSYGKQIARLAKKMRERPQQTHPIEEPLDVRVYMKKGRIGLNYNTANVILVP